MDVTIARKIRKIADSEPGLGRIERIEPLAKGHSADNKYLLCHSNKPAYVLRLSPSSALQQRRKEIENLFLLLGGVGHCESALRDGPGENNHNGLGRRNCVER